MIAPLDCLFFATAFFAAAGLAAAQADFAPAQDIAIASTKDGAQQRALYYAPGGETPVPLLVHLHSWSSDYKSSESLKEALREAAARGWAFVSPDFRGPNNRPEACASALAIQDILDAVGYARSQAKIDAKRIYLLGGSGGGHMSLMMAAQAPKLWAAVSSWVPIADLSDWYESSKAAKLRYSGMLEQCCGGPPTDPRAAEQYKQRSPLFVLDRAKGLPVDIQTGIHDGHGAASVPVRHSLKAFNVLAVANGKGKAAIGEADIATITAEERLPAALAGEKVSEEGRKHTVLFRRVAGPVRITLFDAGHTTDFPTAIRWLAAQRKRN